MTGAREIANQSYVHQRYDEDIEKTISFRPATMESDLGRLHRWLNEPHVQPYWQRDYALPRFREYLDETLSTDHVTPYVGHLDHVPMSYWESYWASDDSLADHYDAQPADQGVHLLIGPPEYLGHGYSTALLREMTAFQFGHPETDRVVTEPDVRNDAVIHVFEKCGFEPQRELELESKDALLMICERDRFESEVYGTV